MGYKIVIPARLNSTRLPRKLLKRIQGKAIVQHVWERCKQTNADDVVIAPDSAEIKSECEKFNAKICLTSESHKSGTDRIAEVCDRYGWTDDDIVVNVQCDEPLIDIDYVNKVARILENGNDFDIATLAHPISDADSMDDPNIVKVVFSKTGKALYFSRMTIPYRAVKAFAHIGLYAYKVKAIKAFTNYTQTELEKLESLEQLRFLENNHNILVGTVVKGMPRGINTEQDYLKVVEMMETDLG